MSGSILVTGANRGLGFHFVEVLLDAGWTVFAGHRDSEAKLAALARGRALHPVLLDVTRPDSVRAAVDAVRAHSDALDIVVNNAAILPEAGRGLLEETNIEVGAQVFDVNSLGPLRVTQAFLPLLRRGKRRLLVNVSSEAGSIADCWRKDEYLYCMSKAALNVQTAILRNALEAEDIRVLAIHPGWIRTDMGGPKAHLSPEEAARALAEQVWAERDRNAPFFVDYRGEALRW